MVLMGKVTEALHGIHASKQIKPIKQADDVAVELAKLVATVVEFTAKNRLAQFTSAKTLYVMSERGVKGGGVIDLVSERASERGSDCRVHVSLCPASSA